MTYPGIMPVDWEERLDPIRMNRERLAKALKAVEHHLVLRREVPEEAPLRHAHRRGDLVDSGLLESLRDEQRLGRPCDPGLHGTA